MITADANFVLRDNTKTFYGGTIGCSAYLDSAGNTKVNATVFGVGTDDEGAETGGIFLEFDTAALTAYTSSGSNEVEKYFNLVEQAVKGYLEGLSDNSGITFSIV